MSDARGDAIKALIAKADALLKTLEQSTTVTDESFKKTLREVLSISLHPTIGNDEKSIPRMLVRHSKSLYKLLDRIESTPASQSGATSNSPNPDLINELENLRKEHAEQKKVIHEKDETLSALRDQMKGLAQEVGKFKNSENQLHHEKEKFAQEKKELEETITHLQAENSALKEQVNAKKPEAEDGRMEEKPVEAPAPNPLQPRDLQENSRDYESEISELSKRLRDNQEIHDALELNYSKVLKELYENQLTPGEITKQLEELNNMREKVTELQRENLELLKQRDELQARDQEIDESQAAEIVDSREYADQETHEEHLPYVELAPPLPLEAAANSLLSMISDKRLAHNQPDLLARLQTAERERDFLRQSLEKLRQEKDNENESLRLKLNAAENAINKQTQEIIYLRESLKAIQDSEREQFRFTNEISLQCRNLQKENLSLQAEINKLVLNNPQNARPPLPSTSAPPSNALTALQPTHPTATSPPPPTSAPMDTDNPPAVNKKRTLSDEAPSSNPEKPFSYTGAGTAAFADSSAGEVPSAKRSRFLGTIGSMADAVADAVTGVAEALVKATTGNSKADNSELPKLPEATQPPEPENQALLPPPPPPFVFDPPKQRDAWGMIKGNNHHDFDMNHKIDGANITAENQTFEQLVQTWSAWHILAYLPYLSAGSAEAVIKYWKDRPNRGQLYPKQQDSLGLMKTPNEVHAPEKGLQRIVRRIIADGPLMELLIPKLQDNVKNEQQFHDFLFSIPGVTLLKICRWHLSASPDGFEIESRTERDEAMTILDELAMAFQGRLLQNEYLSGELKLGWYTETEVHKYRSLWVIAEAGPEAVIPAEVKGAIYGAVCGLDPERFKSEGVKLEQLFSFNTTQRLFGLIYLLTQCGNLPLLKENIAQLFAFRKKRAAKFTDSRIDADVFVINARAELISISHLDSYFLPFAENPVNKYGKEICELLREYGLLKDRLLRGEIDNNLNRQGQDQNQNRQSTPLFEKMVRAVSFLRNNAQNFVSVPIHAEQALGILLSILHGEQMQENQASLANSISFIDNYHLGQQVPANFQFNQYSFLMSEGSALSFENIMTSNNMLFIFMFSRLLGTLIDVPSGDRNAGRSFLNLGQHLLLAMVQSNVGTKAKEKIMRFTNLLISVLGVSALGRYSKSGQGPESTLLPKPDPISNLITDSTGGNGDSWKRRFFNRVGSYWMNLKKKKFIFELWDKSIVKPNQAAASNLSQRTPILAFLTLLLTENDPEPDELLDSWLKWIEEMEPENLKRFKSDHANLFRGWLILMAGKVSAEKALKLLNRIPSFEVDVSKEELMRVLELALIYYHWPTIDKRMVTTNWKSKLGGYQPDELEFTLMVIGKFPPRQSASIPQLMSLPFSILNCSQPTGLSTTGLEQHRSVMLLISSILFMEPLNPLRADTWNGCAHNTQTDICRNQRTGTTMQKQWKNILGGLDLGTFALLFTKDGFLDKEVENLRGETQNKLTHNGAECITPLAYRTKAFCGLRWLPRTEQQNYKNHEAWLLLNFVSSEKWVNFYRKMDTHIKLMLLRWLQQPLDSLGRTPCHVIYLLNSQKLGQKIGEHGKVLDVVLGNLKLLFDNDEPHIWVGRRRDWNRKYPSYYADLYRKVADLPAQEHPKLGVDNFVDKTVALLEKHSSRTTGIRDMLEYFATRPPIYHTDGDTSGYQWYKSDQSTKMQTHYGKLIESGDAASFLVLAEKLNMTQCLHKVIKRDSDFTSQYLKPGSVQRDQDCYLDKFSNKILTLWIPETRRGLRAPGVTWEDALSSNFYVTMNLETFKSFLADIPVMAQKEVLEECYQINRKSYDSEGKPSKNLIHQPFFRRFEKIFKDPKNTVKYKVDEKFSTEASQLLENLKVSVDVRSVFAYGVGWISTKKNIITAFFGGYESGSAELALNYEYPPDDHEEVDSD